MTQEEIIKKAQEVAGEIGCAAYYGGTNIDEDEMADIFFRGANWRINSVWHKMSEEPKRNCMLVLHGYGKTVTFNWNGDIKWKDIGKFFRAEEWAYIEDFLPIKED